jgi:hypothetical protein
MYIPQILEEVSSGVYERKEKCNPLSAALCAHYESAAVRILENDLVHYRGLRKYLAGYLPELLCHYEKATAMGGGNPKLESFLLHAPEIVVVDGFADTYKSSESQFRTIYNVGSNVNIKYVRRQLDCPYKVPADDKSCVTFVHFLEHAANWDTVCSWIENQENDIVIYGPNIAAAVDADWYHFPTVDHNVFFTVGAIAQVGKQCGYLIQSLSYSDDMLVWMRRPGNIRNGIDIFAKAQSVREKLLFAVYYLLEEFGQVSSASAEAGKLLKDGDIQKIRELAEDKIFSRRNKIAGLLSRLDCQHDFYSLERNIRLNKNLLSFYYHCAELEQSIDNGSFNKAEHIFRYNFPAITQSQRRLLNRLRNTLLASEDAALEEKIN